MTPKKLRKPKYFKFEGNFIASCNYDKTIDFWNPCPGKAIKGLCRWLTRANAWIEQQEEGKKKR